MSVSESQVSVPPGGCEPRMRGMAPFHVSSIKGDTDDVIGGALIQPRPPDI